MQHRLAAQIFSFLGPVFRPRLSLTSLWVDCKFWQTLPKQAIHHSPRIEKLFSLPLLKSMIGSWYTMQTSTNPKFLPCHQALPLFSWLCSTGTFGERFMISNHGQAALSILGLVEHLMSTPLTWCTWCLPRMLLSGQHTVCRWMCRLRSVEPGPAGWMDCWSKSCTKTRGFWEAKLCSGAAGVEKKNMVSAFTDQARVINNYYTGLNWGLHVPVTW